MTDLDIVIQELPRLTSGFANTLLLFVISTVGAFLLGALMVGPLRSGSKIVRVILRYYVDGMRMLPFLIFVYLLYYGLPTFGVKLDAWTAGLLGLTVYHCAYVAEILRGAWDQLPVGQTESAQAHGYHGRRLVRRIILPQLVLNTAPVLGNQLIYMLKDTAFLMIITVKELTYAASSIQSMYFVPLEPFLIAIALYWAVTLLIEGLVAKVHGTAKERGLGRA
jgi:polar amino acid transport system permease protein